MTEILDAYSLIMNVTRFNIDSEQHVWLTGNSYSSAKDLEGEYLGDVLRSWLSHTSTPGATTAAPTSTPEATTAAPTSMPEATTAAPTLTPEATTGSPQVTTAAPQVTSTSGSTESENEALKQLAVNSITSTDC
ncbi:unnamed protein product [Phytophthora lilii]|uniref:Unnamed protein product n=1 Tax=Phytophthora lilii TaxID=2077276 RepID=A0A9W6U8W2_9STRA|nr:unnamed protein product [Phytophthora lilii]